MVYFPLQNEKKAFIYFKPLFSCLLVFIYLGVLRKQGTELHSSLLQMYLFWLKGTMKKKVQLYTLFSQSVDKVL